MENQLDDVPAAVEDLTAPVQTATEHVTEALADTNSELHNALRIQGERLEAQSGILGGIQSDVTSLVNALNTLSERVSSGAIEKAGDVAETVEGVPEAAVETTVETASEAPKIVQKGFHGKRKGRR